MRKFIKRIKRKIMDIVGINSPSKIFMIRKKRISFNEGVIKMLKSLWKITILTVDPKLRRYVKGFTKNNNPKEALYFKHMYKIRYDDIVKRIDKRA